MKRYPLAVVIAGIFLLVASCKSADNNADVIATDLCNCFTDFEKTLSSDTKKIFETAANSSDPTKAMEDGVKELSPELQMQVAQEMQSFAEVQDENSKVGRCMKDLEKKYKNAYSMNEEKTMKKILTELDKKKGCEFTASFMKMAITMKDKK